MKRLLLLFALFALLGAPALAQLDEPVDQDSETITNLDANTAVIYTHGKWRKNPSIVISGCFKNRGYVLQSFNLQFMPPASTPDSYFIRWSARKDGKWQPKTKSNSKRAGNLTLRADWLINVNSAGWHTSTDDTAEGYVTINSSMHKLAAPVGDSMKIQIRPVYGDRMGPKARININTYDWHMAKRPRLANC